MAKYIIKTIHILPSELNNSIFDTINNSIKKFERECDLKYGYIKKVYLDEVPIYKNIISSTCKAVIFQVKFKADTLLPKVGDIFEGKVIAIFSHSVMVEVQGILKIIITSSKMSNYTYNAEKNTYEKEVKKGKKSFLQIGDTVRIKIEAVNFSKKRYNCVGILV